MVALVTIGAITITVAGVYIGKWLKSIMETNDQRYNERLKTIQGIDKDLKEYAKKTKSLKDRSDDSGAGADV